MQRRAAAVYAVFFLVIAAGAYSVIGAAQAPGISVSGPTYAAGDSLTVGDRTYTVSQVGETTGTLTWVNQSARQTESWDAHVQRFEQTPGSGAGAGQGVPVNQDIPTVTVQGTDYRVVVQPAGDPTEFFLVEAVSLGENTTTVTQDGVTYVVTEGDDGPDLTPVHEWIQDTRGPPDVRAFAEGDTLTYQNQTATITAVANESVTVAWRAPAENTINLNEGRQVTLGTTEYVAHFPTEGEVQLSTDVKGYQEDVQVVDNFDERIAGLWGVTILSGLAAALLLGLAYMPSRY